MNYPTKGVWQILKAEAYEDKEDIRSAYRGDNVPAVRNHDVGFRPARTFTP